MNRHKVLVTCPPMLGLLDDFIEYADQKNIDLVRADVEQTLTEKELKTLLPDCNGWIIGDDPASKDVFLSAKSKGKFKAAVKWGIGTDNIDFEACKLLGIPITNTPGMFGREVADIAVGYLIALARHTFQIDRGIRQGQWPKPTGLSIADKVVALIGYGDIGRNTAKRLIAADMKIIAYDPYITEKDLDLGVSYASWPERIEEADFIIINCSLTKSSYHLLNSAAFKKMKKGVRIVNVGRGPIIEENALIEAIESGQVISAALDVFENEPLNHDSKLRGFESCILGSHNASNTYEGVIKTSLKSIDILYNFLNA